MSQKSPAKQAGVVRRKSAGYQLAFISDITWGNLLRSGREHCKHLLSINPLNLPKVAGTLVLSTAMAPFRIWERLRWNRKIARTELSADPVFIVGHWRSGTTHLHNLMSQDERFGYITNLHTAIPETFLSWSGPARWLFDRLVPSVRPMDNMRFNFNDPQECEIALSKVFPHTYFSHLVVPNLMIERFESSILLQGVSPKERRLFGEHYRKLVKKTTISSGGKPLLLKNPANTGRLEIIREIFPQSKFIFIHRNPYDVFSSMKNFYSSLIPMLAWHNISPEELQELILSGYEMLHRQYLRQREQLPEDQIIEVGFDQLEQQPMELMERIYNHSGEAPQLEQARSAMETYLESVRDYRKNEFNLPVEIVQEINDRWGFAFDEWGYTRRQVDTHDGSTDGQ